MKRFLCFLVVLATASFFAGFQSVDPRRDVEEGVGQTSRDRQFGFPTASGSGSGSRARQRSARPPLAREVLQKVQFEKFRGDKVAPVARKVYQLSREDCLQINEAVRMREEELALLRETQEAKAFRIEPTGEWESQYFWEIPVDKEAGRQIWLRFREQVASVVGDEISESLLGEFEHREAPPEHQRRHLMVAYPGGSLMRIEFTEVGGRMYSTQQRRMEKSEASQPLVAMIDQALEQAGEAPLRK